MGIILDENTIVIIKVILACNDWFLTLMKYSCLLYNNFKYNHINEYSDKVFKV